MPDLWSSHDAQVLGGLAGDCRYKLGALVAVQDREPGELGGGRDEQVGGRGAVLPSVGEQGQDLHCAVLDGRGQVLRRHG